MSHYHDLSAVEEQITSCMRCGNCQAACPYYRETGSESSVARGRIRLARAVLTGELKYTPALAERFECLTCYACNATCPCGVKIDKVLLAARAAMVREGGTPALKKLMAIALKNQRLLDLGFKTTARAKGLFLKPHPAGGLSPRFPLGLELRRVVPPLSPKPFRGQVRESVPVPGAGKKVAFFTGCLNNYVYPSTSHAVVEALTKSNVSVLIPREQHCCGAPLVINGVIDVAEEMARSHVDLFSGLGIDALVVACGTCGESFKRKYVDLLDGAPGYANRARELAAKTYDIGDFVCNVAPFDRKRLREVAMKVTYHEPCHLGRGLGVTAEPVEIIRSIPGLDFIPLKEPNRCCGNAGSFSFTHYDVSYNILKRKLTDVAGTGAETVITGCGACRMQLEDGIAQEGLGKKVFHTAEILALALR
ncbi:MAG: (Fe-S)-binding protein [Desulfotomaculaceae bacterium]|nr:(Fe-S)-binding protein [Desulfotomaculaceae bacterium]